MHVELRGSVFDPWRELAAYQQAQPELRGCFGATAAFVGTMRDYNEGAAVRAMFLEHYPGMTERHLARITAQAVERWALEEALVLHRVGAVEPGEPIVLVAVWSGHRREAFEACRYIMEDLKSQAPFWKKEDLGESARWVTGNTPG